MLSPRSARRPRRVRKLLHSNFFVLFATFVVKCSFRLFAALSRVSLTIEQDHSHWLRVNNEVSQFRDLGQRTRLCFKPKLASIAAIRIGAPMPSTTGTPSWSCNQSGLM